MLEAASDLGARPWRRFVDVTLPLAVPGIVAGSLLVFIPAVGEYVIPALMGGADTIMVGRVLFDEFFLQPRLGGCLSGGDGATNRAGRAHYVFPTPTSKKRSYEQQPFLLVNFILGAGLAFLYLPILSLIVYSFNDSRLATIWGGFSTKWYGKLWENDAIIDAALLSFRIAAVSATGAMILGTMAGLTLGRKWILGGDYCLSA